MIPIESYGVKCISIGSLVDEREAIVWRGPMVWFCLQTMTYIIEFSTFMVISSAKDFTAYETHWGGRIQLSKSN